MTSIYISTARKPTQNTRILAKALSRLLKAEYENRGKRSMSDIVQRAENLGCRRLAFIYERHGSPTRIAFYEDGWLPEEIRIKHFEVLKGKRMEGALHIEAADKGGEKMQELLAIESSDIDDEMVGAFSENYLEFTVESVLVLKMKVELREIVHEEGSQDK